MQQLVNFGVHFHASTISSEGEGGQKISSVGGGGGGAEISSVEMCGPYLKRSIVNS